MKYPALLFFLFFVVLHSSSANDAQVRSEPITYKEVNGVELVIHMIAPTSLDVEARHPAIVFFFGGGWKKGNVKQFMPQAEYFATRGVVSFLVDYRVTSRHGSTPFDSLEDAKSAMRYVRENASRFFVDPNRIVACGASAGGQLAAATAAAIGFNCPNDDLSISSVPNALILFNPVIDNGPDGVGHHRIGDRYKKFSPLHTIRKGMPPTIIFQGTKDRYIPVETIQSYREAMQAVGSRCDLFLYEGQKHAFFNRYAGEKYYRLTLREADQFLISLGFLNGAPTVF